MSTFTTWAKDVALRAVKTAAQASVATVTANTAGITHLNLGAVGAVAGLSAVVCVLQNLANLHVADPENTVQSALDTAASIAPHEVASRPDPVAS